MTTVGSELVAQGQHRRVWRMAGPIIVSNLSVPLLGAVDTAVVGHLPEPYYLGAVAVGTMIFNFIYWGFNFLRMGTTGPTAQAAGAEDAAEVRATLGRALILAGAIAGGVLVLQLPIAWFAFGLVEASPEVEALGRSYFLIRVWAAPAALATYAIIGWFYGLQDARRPLVLQIFTNGINIALDLLFVFGFGWGVEGVAAATVIAETAGLALGLWLVVRRLGRLPPGRKAVAILDPGRMKRMIAVNRDIFLRTLCLLFTMAYFTALGARLGDVTLAANQVLLNFLMFSAYGLDGFAHAAEALVGEAVGRRNRAAFEKAVRTAFGWAAFVAGINVMIYWIAGDAIIGLFTNIEEVRAVARDFLPWAVVLPAVSIWGYLYDGVYLGATTTRYLRNSMVIAAALYLLAAHLMLPVWGNHGLWMALTLFLALRGVTLAFWYPRLARSVG